MVDARMFLGAPSFAMGGEVPAILHRGEEVLTRSDPRHRRNAGGSISFSPSTVININGPTTEAMQANFARELDRRDRRLKEAIPDVIRRHQSNNRM